VVHIQGHEMAPFDVVTRRHRELVRQNPFLSRGAEAVALYRHTGDQSQLQLEPDLYVNGGRKLHISGG